MPNHLPASNIQCTYISGFLSTAKCNPLEIPAYWAYDQTKHIKIIEFSTSPERATYHEHAFQEFVF